MRCFRHVNKSLIVKRLLRYYENRRKNGLATITFGDTLAITMKASITKV